MKKIIRWVFERPIRFGRVVLFASAVFLALVILIELINWIF